MNQKESPRWELKLGLFQLVILLGLVMGLLTCTFFLGYFSGRQVGHDAALSASLSNTIKMPIGAQDQEERVDEEASRKAASEVYAQLNETQSGDTPPAAGTIAQEMPKLGAIDSTSESPVDEVATEPSAAGENPAKNQAALNAEVIEPTPLPSRDQLLKEVIEEEGKKTPVAEPTTPKAQLTPSVTQTTAAKPSPKVTLAATATPTAKVTRTAASTPTPRPTKAAAASAGGTLPSGWYAQIAAPKKKEDAAELSSKLRKSGFAVIVEVAIVNNVQYYRVLTGPESNKAQADKLVEQLKREPYIQSQPFIRQIK